MNAADRLAGFVLVRLKPHAADWLRDRLAAVAANGAELGLAFAAAGRRAGRDPLLEPPLTRAVRLSGDDGPILNSWRLDEAARVLLLLAEAAREPAAAPARAVELYREGSGQERIAVVRALQVLPEALADLEVVRDALRANAADLFAAAICENLYTSTHLPDELFFQAVLKAVFVGLPLGRIERLEERATPELARMLFAYVTEREAAGRTVPADVWPLIALFPPPGVADRISARLEATNDIDRPLLDVALERARR